MSQRWRAICLVSALIIPFLSLCFGSETRRASAQSDTLQWSVPFSLSNTNGPSVTPAIAADAWGRVHAFWLEKEPTDTLMYRQFDGQAWSDPLDIFAGEIGATLEYPAAAADAVGNVHLVWSGPEGLYHTSAFGTEAPLSARSWQSPQAIAHAGPVNRPSIVADEEGIVHVVYGATDDDRNIYYLRSTDGGLTWGSDALLSSSPSSEDNTHGGPRLAIDEAGRLHVAWYEAAPPTWNGVQIWYTRSEDGGNSWPEPTIISEPSRSLDKDEMQGAVSLATSGTDRVVAVWVCGTVTYRCGRTSSDGGKSWEPVQRLFGERQSRAGWDSIGSDAAGTVYLMAQLRSTDIPSAVYVATFSDGRWTEPPTPIITEGSLHGAHHLQMATNEGNRLHAVLEDYAEAEVYYMTTTTGAPHHPPSTAMPVRSTPTPVPSPTALPALDAEAEGHFAVPAEPVLPAHIETTMPALEGPSRGLLVGILPALLLVAGVAGFSFLRAWAK